MYSIRKRGIVPGYLLGLSAAAVLLTLPAVASAQSTKNLEQRVAKMERMLDSGTLLNLLQSVEQLQAEVRELRGQLEQQQNAVSQLTERQKELYLEAARARLPPPVPARRRVPRQAPHPPAQAAHPRAPPSA